MAMKSALTEIGIRDKIKMLNLGIDRTRERLTAFEKQFGMSSTEFERKFNARELAEDLDLIDWQGEIKTFRHLQDQLNSLQKAHIA